MRPAFFRRTRSVGSSSIRLWKLDTWFPKLSAVNRGFGGSEISDVNYFADRIVFRHKPRVIVFYAGDNDIVPDTQSPQDVLADADTVSATDSDDDADSVIPPDSSGDAQNDTTDVCVPQTVKLAAVRPTMKSSPCSWSCGNRGSHDSMSASVARPSRLQSAAQRC